MSLAFLALCYRLHGHPAVYLGGALALVEPEGGKGKEKGIEKRKSILKTFLLLTLSSLPFLRLHSLSAPPENHYNAPEGRGRLALAAQLF